MEDRLAKQATPRKRRSAKAPAAGPKESAADALIRAARELLVELGPGYVTLTAVAERAGVNPALVKYHFGSKYELFSATLMHVLDEWAPQFVAIVNQGGSTIVRLTARIELLVDLQCRDPYVYSLMQEQMQEGRQSAAAQRFQEYMKLSLEMNRRLLAEGVASGELIRTSPLHVNMVLLGIAQYFATARALMEEFANVRYTPEFVAEFKRQVVGIVLNGIGTPQASKPSRSGKLKAH
jgi:AcrR family transcriptional regulator